MSDNIRNFSDYRKQRNLDEQQTEEINIEIQDPLDFFSENEREEYYRTRREEMDRERESIPEESEEFYLDDIQVEEPDLQQDIRPAAQDDTRDEESVNRRANPSKERRKEKQESAREINKKASAGAEKKQNIRKQRKTSADEDDWFDEDGDDRDYGGVNPYVIVRIASIISGVVILVLIAMIFKAKVYDRYLIPDPDETEVEAEIGELEGYTITNDKIVTTADLNIRNTPSTASDDFIVAQVTAGTVLDRVAVSDDGKWAQIKYEYNGKEQLFFCSMKYATVQE